MTEEFRRIPITVGSAQTEGYMFVSKRLAALYEDGSELVMNPTFKLRPVTHDGVVVGTVKELESFTIYPILPDIDVGPPKPAELSWVWKCVVGHECVISESVLRQALVQPRCTYRNPETGYICGQTLEKKLRPYG